MAVTVYRCRNPKCGNTDRDRGLNPPAPTTLICSIKACRHEMLPVPEEEFVERDMTPAAAQEC